MDKTKEYAAMTEVDVDGMVGVIGLGVMGRAYVRHLLASGKPVLGFDVDDDAARGAVELGGSTCGSAKEVAERSDVILLALPSVVALEGAVSGKDGIAAGLRPGAIVCEMGTFSVEDKLRAAEGVEGAGGMMLDCPVSGTGAQAWDGDLVVYASGNETALAKARPALEAISREVRYVGPFGSGMKMKIVANLLVSIHNLAAAEALLLAQRAGLDLEMVYEAISAGAGTSRMFEVRGPLMISQSYEPPTMKHEVFAKDLGLILDHAQSNDVPTPLLAAAKEIYARALDEGRGGEDTASLFEVLKGMSSGSKQV